MPTLNRARPWRLRKNKHKVEKRFYGHLIAIFSSARLTWSSHGVSCSVEHLLQILFLYSKLKISSDDSLTWQGCLVEKIKADWMKINKAITRGRRKKCLKTDLSQFFLTLPSNVFTLYALCETSNQKQRTEKYHKFVAQNNSFIPSGNKIAEKYFISASFRLPSMLFCHLFLGFFLMNFLCTITARRNNSI